MSNSSVVRDRMIEGFFLLEQQINLSAIKRGKMKWQTRIEKKSLFKSP